MKINLIECVSKSYLKTSPTKGQNCCYIINLDDTVGSHWTCIFVNRVNEAVFIDSYGQLPPMHVITFFKNNNIKWFYSTTQVQDYSSVLCGYFCIYFLFYMTKYSKNQSNNNLRYLLNKILDKFDDDNQETNDEMLHKEMTELIKKYYILQ
jgi:hypothetical protein